MLVNADVKGLEVVTAAFLSGDEILKQEVRDGVDFHETNKQAFNLTSRLIAKIFMFKLIYGATAWSFANDADFDNVSTSERFWQSCIDNFYHKYHGLYKWHVSLMQNAVSTGLYITPTGRRYAFDARDVVKREWFWRPKVLNYPVQGLGADLVMLARINLWNLLKHDPFPQTWKYVSSVHDSILLDVSSERCYNIGMRMKNAIEAVPTAMQCHFGVNFDLPLTCELKQGCNMFNMEILDVRNDHQN